MTYNKRHMSGGTLQRWLIALATGEMAISGMTTRQLAARVGVSEQHMSTVLNGHQMGTLALWNRVLAALGIEAQITP